MKKIDLTKLTPTEIKLLDELSDGQWHSISKIKKEVDKRASVKASLEDIVLQMEKLGWLKSGNNNSYRMLPNKVDEWRRISPSLDKTDRRKQPRYFGGVIEDDGWELAPLQTYDMVHFKATNASITQVKEYIKSEYENITIDEVGLIRIFAKDGLTLYEELTQLKESEPWLGIYGLRKEKGLRRRNLEDLPKKYVSDLCDYYGKFARVLLRSYMSSINKHLDDPDDIQQQIYSWIIDAIQRYDNETSIPFAAYLANSLKKWVFNLGRKSYGRAMADAELKHSRVIADFKAKMHRDPTSEELSELLDVNHSALAKEQTDMSIVAGIRNAVTIYASEDDEFELHLPASESTTEDVESLVEATLISASIKTSAFAFPTEEVKLSALLAVYYEVWGQGTKSKQVVTLTKDSEFIKLRKKTLAKFKTIVKEALDY